MYTSGQTINYEKYIEILNTIPAPILGTNCRMLNWIWLVLWTMPVKRESKPEV